MSGKDKRFTKEDVDEMIKLRLEGWSYPALAKKFNCDHASVCYWCYKRGLKRVQFRKPKETKKYSPICILRGMETKLPNIEMNITRERLNEGKSYQEYLKSEKDKKFRELLTSKR